MPKKSGDFLGKVESRWALAKEFGAIPMLGGVVSGAFAWATDFLSVWAPLSYFFAVVTGVILFQLGVFLSNASAERAERKRRIEMLAAPKGQINPLSDSFENQRIHISDLLPPLSKKIENKTLRNCEIVGPANIIFSGSGQLIECNFVDVDGIITDDGVHSYNSVALKDCHIRGCRFFNVSVVMPYGDYIHFKGKLPNMTWLNEGILGVENKPS